MLPTKFRFIWTSGFREDFKKLAYQKQELPVATMFVNGSGRNDQPLQRTFHRCFPPNCSSFGKAVSKEKIFQKSTNQKQEWPVVAMFVNGSELNEQSSQTRGPSKDASCQVLIHLARRFQRRRFFQKSTNQKQEWPVVAMFINGSGRNEQSLQRTFHRCFLPSFGSFGLAVSEETI